MCIGRKGDEKNEGRGLQRKAEKETKEREKNKARVRRNVSWLCREAKER